jgi:hypothetical protein
MWNTMGTAEAIAMMMMVTAKTLAISVSPDLKFGVSVRGR